ncbi:MAG: 30S ribosomal protein S11 [archaeon]
MPEDKKENTKEEIKEEKIEEKEDKKPEVKDKPDKTKDIETEAKDDKAEGPSSIKDTFKPSDSEAKPKPKSKKDIEAVVNIYTSFNNTIVHVTDMSGRTISKVTGGMTTKHGRLKANPTIAMFIAKRITENIKDLGVRSLYVRIRAKTRNPAPGPGANAIIKSLSREGFKVLNVLDTTRIPRGGPKKKGGRRGRRP